MWYNRRRNSKCYNLQVLYVEGGILMLMMKVRYNGDTYHYKPCDEPKALKKGKRYKVIGFVKGEFQTNLILKGIKGEFNSLWFDEWSGSRPLSKPVYHCSAPRLPKVGEQLVAFDSTRGIDVLSSTVKSIKKKHWFSRTWRVETRNTIYLVKLA